MTDIIDQIDTATGCQRCGKDLSQSVSDDFCSEYCQARWHQDRSTALPPFSLEPPASPDPGEFQQEFTCPDQSVLTFALEVPLVTRYTTYRLARCTNCSFMEYTLSPDPVDNLHYCLNVSSGCKVVLWHAW